MSVRVNLLPGEQKARGAASRTRALVALGFVVLIAGLGALTFLQMGSISDAEDQLAAVQSTNTELQARVAALEPYAALERRLDEASTQVGTSLAGEGSLAGVLQDLAAVLPPSVELQSISVTVNPAPSSPQSGGDRFVYGSMNISGQLAAGYSPGVEGLLIAVDRVAAFDNAFATGTAQDEDGIVTFSLDVDLGPEVLTGRYDALLGGAE